MAQRTVLVDDLGDGDAAETITFALDGVEYEIDLSEGNAAQLRDDLATWVAHARSIGGRRRVGRKAAATRDSKIDNGVVRAWARDNGHAISDRGRIPAEIIEAYLAAN